MKMKKNGSTETAQPRFGRKTTSDSIKEMRRQSHLIPGVSAVPTRSTEEYRQLFCEYVLPLQEKLWKLIKVHVPAEQDAEDVYQQVFENCWKSLPDLKNPKHVEKWADRIARRTISNYNRALLREQIVLCSDLLYESDAEQNDTLISEQDVENEFLHVEKMEALWEAYGKLGEKYRAIIWLWYERDLSLKEVAAELGWNYNSVRVQFSRGIKQWKKLYLQIRKEENDHE